MLPNIMHAMHIRILYPFIRLKGITLEKVYRTTILKVDRQEHVKELHVVITHQYSPHITLMG